MELTMHNDWYAYLGLSPDATTEEIQRGVERLNWQASALAATSPERSQLLRETIRAIKRDLLSGSEDQRTGFHAPPGQDSYYAPGPVPPSPYPPGGQSAGSRLARFLRTGWTCPACGKGGVPSDKFCTKCGTPLQAIRPDTAPGPERAARPRPACSACANPLSPMDAFCSKCGTRR